MENEIQLTRSLHASGSNRPGLKVGAPDAGAATDAESLLAFAGSLLHPVDYLVGLLGVDFDFEGLELGDEASLNAELSELFERREPHTP